MVSTEQVREVIGGTLYDRDGDKVGKIGQVFLDDETGRPEWVTVNTGFFGANESFVPIADAEVTGNDLRVPFEKAQIKDAPNVSADAGHLSQEEEADLYRYYGLSYGESRSDSGLPEGGVDTGDTDTTTTGVVGGVDRDREGTVGHDTSGPTTDDAMTRSEERLRVGKEQTEAGRARLRKYVVTENVTQTVPVTREEVRVEREPITDENVGAALDGPAISEEEHEVVLHEERPVVQKEAVPVERVRLGKEQVTEEHTVSEDVRKEQIDTDGVTDTTGTRRDTDRI